MNYLVMECHPGYAVVLSNDGRFLKVANLRYEVGQTVTDVTELRLPQAPARPAGRSLRWVAALAACLVLVFTSVLFAGQLPYASVYLTINPEVRIDVSRTDAVVAVEGMNEDGIQLLAGYDYAGKELDTVMDELVDRAIDMGYLHEGGTITLSLDGDEEWVTSHSQHLNEHLSQHLTDKITVTIDIGPIPGQTVETVVIPVSPDDYGESDYGGETIPEDGDTPYEMPEDGQSEYEVPTDDGQSEYEAPTDDGQSEYEVPVDDGQSEYEVPVDDGQSEYEAPEDDGNSDYEEPEDDDGDD